MLEHDPTFGAISAGEFKDFIGEYLRLDPINLHRLRLEKVADACGRFCRTILETSSRAWQSRRMSTKVLEQTVNDLQRRVTELEGKISGKASDGWRKIVGAAKNDQYFAEAMRLGAKWRKKANREKW